MLCPLNTPVKGRSTCVVRTGPEFAGVRAILDHDLTMRDAEIRWMRQLITQGPQWPESVLAG